MSYIYLHSRSTLYVCALGHAQLFAIPWTIARQVPLSRGRPRQEYCSELPFPSPGDLPDSGIDPVSLASPALQANVLPLTPPEIHLSLDFPQLWQLKRKLSQARAHPPGSPSHLGQEQHVNEVQHLALPGLKPGLSPLLA